MSKVKHSVLIVDDMETDIAMLTKLLCSEYVVYSAQNGHDAIAAAEKYLPDVIMLDVIMDDMDGYDTIAALKKSEKTKDIPVIFLTSLSEREEEEKGLALGAADYVTKPFSSAIIKLRIKNQINIVEQMRTIKRQNDSIQSFEYENIKIMLDTMPHACHLWDKDQHILDCNEANLRLFKLDNKEDFIKRFFDFSPERQDDGILSSEKAIEMLEGTLEKGFCASNWTYVSSTGDTIPCRTTGIRVKLRGDDHVVVYIDDLSERAAMTEEIKRQDQLLYTVNSIAGILLQSTIEDFADDMHLCTGMMAEAVDADRVYIWKNYVENDELFCAQLFEWADGDGARQGNGHPLKLSYREKIPDWEEVLSVGGCINSEVRNMTSASRRYLSTQGVASIFIAPIFMRNEFWGFIGFDDCHKERVFSENEETILRAAGLMIVNVMLRNEMTVNIKSSAEMLK